MYTLNILAPNGEVNNSKIVRSKYSENRVGGLSMEIHSSLGDVCKLPYLVLKCYPRDKRAKISRSTWHRAAVFSA